MKKHLLLLIAGFGICNYLTAQILCVNCYNQNDSISHNVNNLLLNGGFENTTCIPWPTGTVYCPNSASYGCDITNWTCTGGGPNTYTLMADSASGFTIITEGTLAAYFGNNFCRLCSPVLDDTSCLTESQCVVAALPAGYPDHTPANGGTTSVSLEQTVSGLTIGNTYVLEFWTGGEAGVGSFLNEGLFAVDIGFGKTFLRNPPTVTVTGIGRVFLIQFTADSTSHTIKFTNWGHICSTCTELVLDNVRLYSLAELDTSVASCLTSVSGLQPASASLVLAPNPAQDILNISLNYSNNPNYLNHINYPITISVTDIMGKEIFNTRTTTLNFKLQTSGFPKGMYYVTILGEKINEVAKFIKN